MQVTEYDADSLITVHMNGLLKTLLDVSVPNNTKTYSLMISFLKTEIDLSEEISLNQFSDLISSLGGNLGLFTGFSILSGIEILYFTLPIGSNSWYKAMHHS